MNNKLLEEIRRILQNKVNSQYDSVKDDYPDGLGGAMLITEDTAKAHQSRELLEMLPEPEHEAVLDYQALIRASNVDVDGRVGQPSESIQHILREEAFKKEQKALDVVKDRIEVKQKADGEILLEDPITKVKMRYDRSTKPGQEEVMDMMVENFARDIINYGVDR